MIWQQTATDGGGRMEEGTDNNSETVEKGGAGGPK